ncbi:MAG: hypothetical protein HXY27_05140 [Hydrogenophilaceae bacterium]|nr:hypothetical protein [Hydrogenophilaceae bacterium]
MSEAAWFNTPVEYAEALDRLLGQASRDIRIYDWDLSDGGYEQPMRIRLLNDFCKQGNRRQIRILLADDAWLTRHAGQLMHLLSVWGHVMEIRIRDSEPPPEQDCFVLTDDHGVLKRFDKDNTKGVMRLNSRGDVVDLGIRFDSEWERAPGRVAPRALGL